VSRDLTELTMSAVPNEPRAVDAPTREQASGSARSYLRFAALGDSVTYGLGDVLHIGSRGWARILADAMAQEHEVSFCNSARAGALVADVRHDQLAQALAHRPHLASLIVGLNDTMRSTWDPRQLRADLVHCADRLTEQGATLLTIRFHDHTRIFRLPGLVARPLRARIDALNEVYDEIHDRHGSIRVDLGAHPGVYDRDFWSIDRLHPSELGHRALAHEFAALLGQHGLHFHGPSLDLDGPVPNRLDNLLWMLAEGAPWVARRVRDLAPSLARGLVPRGGT
jgi:lysophospholipase L1-like esterase